jgi:hypothetical protein
MRSFNEKLALFITKYVGTMYCAYVFAVMGGAGVYYALTHDTQGVLIVGAISGYFLQLVLLPIIMVGQSVHTETIKKHVTAVHTGKK